MNNFRERGKSFETEFSRNQELAFRITARRNRLFGVWAAEKLGLAAGEPVETYAKAVVAADFDAKRIIVTEAELRAELARAAAEARRQMLANGESAGPPHG